MKSDSAYSWVPSYFVSKQFTFKMGGIYKYLVPLGFEQFSDGIPIDLINTGKTRKRNRIYCELEYEFVLEE
jgi:hypothetical protein